MKFSVFLTAIVLLTVTGSPASFAAKVDTVQTQSSIMNKSIKAVIITPDSYEKKGLRFPVVYLLHGYGGNYSSFIKGIPELTQYADELKMILVCADGNVGSWYFDSPVDPSWKYETYVSNELVKWVDKNYRTISSSTGRGVTGYSMGGHGALYLSFKHPEVFGTAGSMSGGVDFRPFPKNWQIAGRLGPYAENKERWDQYTVTNMLDLVKPGSLALIIDCGIKDFFFAVNEEFHKKLLEKGIDHDYIIRPGIHNMPYWRNAIAYQLVFMSKYFNSANQPGAKP